MHPSLVPARRTPADLASWEEGTIGQIASSLQTFTAYKVFKENYHLDPKEIAACLLASSTVLVLIFMETNIPHEERKFVRLCPGHLDTEVTIMIVTCQSKPSKEAKTFIQALSLSTLLVHRNSFWQKGDPSPRSPQSKKICREHTGLTLQMHSGLCKKGIQHEMRVQKRPQRERTGVLT